MRKGGSEIWVGRANYNNNGGSQKKKEKKRRHAMARAELLSFVSIR